MTELAAQGNYNRQENSAWRFKCLHPSHDLRDQVKLFRRLESQPANRAFSSVPVERKLPGRTAGTPVSERAGCFHFYCAQRRCFRYRARRGDWNDPEVLRRIGALDPGSVVVQGRILAASSPRCSCTPVFFILASICFALYVLGPPLERTIGTVRFVVCYLDFRARLDRRRNCVDLSIASDRNRLSWSAPRARLWASSARGRDFCCDIATRRRRNNDWQISR